MFQLKRVVPGEGVRNFKRDVRRGWIVDDLYVQRCEILVLGQSRLEGGTAKEVRILRLNEHRLEVAQDEIRILGGLDDGRLLGLLRWNIACRRGVLLARTEEHKVAVLMAGLANKVVFGHLARSSRNSLLDVLAEELFGGECFHIDLAQAFQEGVSEDRVVRRRAGSITVRNRLVTTTRHDTPGLALKHSGYVRVVLGRSEGCYPGIACEHAGIATIRNY